MIIVMTVDAMKTDGAMTNFAGQNGAQLECRSQLHIHRAHEVLFGEQRKRRTIDRVFAENLCWREKKVTNEYMSRFPDSFSETCLM